MELMESLDNGWREKFQTGGVLLLQYLQVQNTENPLASALSGASICDEARIWWNWQTRYFEVVVPQGVQVQVLLSAPTSLELPTLTGALISLVFLVFRFHKPVSILLTFLTLFITRNTV